MRNLLTKIARWGTSLALVAGFLSPALSLAAEGTARFNSDPRDNPTLQVTKAGVAYSNATSITAQKGDVLNILLWDHNSNPVGSAVARNVRAKINVPSTVAANHTVTGQVSADNAATVTGSVAVATGQETHLSYIPGTARLYNNVNDKLVDVGSVSDQIVTTGVNLGDQAACWQYARAVMVQVEVTGTNPAINTNKKVGLFNGNAYADQVTAHPGDTVVFKVFVQNTGDGTGINTQVIDNLDSRLTYEAGSSKLYYKVNNQDRNKILPNPDRDGQKLTWKLDNMLPRPDAAVYLTFRAKVAGNESFAVGQTILQNCAQATFTGVSKNTNCVTVVVTKNGPTPTPTPTITPTPTPTMTPTPTPTPTQNPSYMLNKRVRLVSAGVGSPWYDDVAAEKGAEVEFQIRIVNTSGNAVSNVLIKDILPAGLSFSGGGMLFNKQNENGTDIDASKLFSTGYLFTSLGAGTDNGQTIQFKATVKNQAVCDADQVNAAQLLVGGQVKITDYATVFVSCRPGLHIVKDVLEQSTGMFKDNAGTVVAGQTLKYRIRVYNSGTATIVKPYLKDVLPGNMTYVLDTLTIDGEKMVKENQDQFFSSRGMLLTDFTSGMSKEIIFEVTLGVCPPGSVQLTNTAVITAEGDITLQDTAVVVLAACNAPVPTTPATKPVGPLPRTGPEAAVALMGSISGLGVGLGRYFQLKNKLKKGVNNLDII